jgi:predicted NUDIX family NTP pyrophosphohydrolase
LPQRSAGIMIYWQAGERFEVLLVHPGGPFWATKDDGAWSIPKGLVKEGEDTLAAAQRETREEIGVELQGPFTKLGEYKQPGGKIVCAWAAPVDAQIDTTAIKSNTFTMEWPPRSGSLEAFPEVDRAGWFSLAEAHQKILQGQRPMLADLQELLAGNGK